MLNIAEYVYNLLFVLKALQKMRSYEERMAEARKKALNDENNYDILIDEDETVDAVNVAASENSSAYDVASETSSELQQPSIDTQKLDKQIKSIMMVCFIVIIFIITPVHLLYHLYSRICILYLKDVCAY